MIRLILYDAQRAIESTLGEVVFSFDETTRLDCGSSALALTSRTQKFAASAFGKARHGDATPFPFPAAILFCVLLKHTRRL